MLQYCKMICINAALYEKDDSSMPRKYFPNDPAEDIAFVIIPPIRGEIWYYSKGQQPDLVYTVFLFCLKA